ncbi:hypothetical protein PF010_g23346 [Phytophthora fragariae]|uniref:G-patch domain-containing protein n=1 Tax=Phytophthora fragariae TaxID=53985 RepID=A0A6G0K6Q5_9STRA|nr:hypothetical protein PF010_g23346 [Phytophthora fragariae]
MKRGGVRNQEVTDAQGRRRFHGAFTGGYSAGYYNSVGSEEGWTPRTFSSSRGDRMPRVEQRAEDFMDEEDDPLLGKRLETTERYDTLQTGAKRRLQQQQQTDQGGAGAGAIPGFALPDDWVLPVDDSIGAKLLKQMGWKEGHGIGQRVRRRKFLEEKEGEETPKLLTQGVQEETTEMGARVDAEEEVYVPPRKVFDVQKAFPKPKLDRYGAGFDPYTNAPEFSRYKQQEEEKQRAKEGSHRQVVSFSDALKATNGSNRATTAYGLSALEEDDDIDVYGSVSMAEFDRVDTARQPGKEANAEGESAQDSELAPLPAVKIASASLLKSIFEPSDESDESDNDSEDESDDEVNGEDQKEEIVQANRGPLSLPEKLSQRKDFESDRHAASSAESSSSDDDISSSFAVAPGSGDGEKSKQGVKRSKSVDGDDEQHTKEKKRTHKKHKKHHRSKHRSSREDKDKKKDKKNRKERHKHRSSRHSRRSQSRSQSRERSAADRHRSSSNRRR